MSTTAPTAFTHRNRLLSSCAVAAIALAAQAQPLRAQVVNGGFRGTPTLQNKAIVTTGADTSTKVEIIAPRAIVNWNASDNNFLPEGAVANFSGANPYIVLNRITPASPNAAIQLNGIVNSTIAEARGGDVWFYSPSGILVGASGRFNVGSLLLTANPLTMGDDAFIQGETLFNFSRDVGNAAVEIDRDAMISALGSNAYVALIAPRVRQSGEITVNGSAAYVAADKVSMTISGSLFDIEVTGGSERPSTDDDKILVHDGTTNLRNEDSSTDESGNTIPGGPRHAIMVAVPKNDAVTLLLSGSVEYQPAAVAGVVENRIILSAGHGRVSNGEIGNRVPNTPDANIVIASNRVPSNFAADVVGAATGTATAFATADNPLQFAMGLDLAGSAGVLVEARQDASISIGGNLALNVLGDENSSAARASLIAREGSSIVVNGSSVEIGAEAVGSHGGDGTGGASVVSNLTAEIVSDGGRIIIQGGVDVHADAHGGDGSELGPGGDAKAGTARIVTNSLSSVIEIGDFVSVSASGYGGSGSSGGSGTGGTAGIIARGGGALGEFRANIVSRDAEVYAQGQGGSTFEGQVLLVQGTGGDGTGGDGTGGTAIIEAGIATVVNVGNDVTIDASAQGGDGNSAGGNATAGSAILRSNPGSEFENNGELAMYARARGGFSSNGAGGDAFGKSIVLESIGGDIYVEGEASLDTTAYGGGGDTTGGTGTGGSIRLAARDDGLLDIASTPTADATGYGGYGHDGGDGFGGVIDIEAAGAELDLGRISFIAEGYGGDAGTEYGYGNGAYGDGTGGHVTVTTSSSVVDGETLDGFIDSNDMIIRAGGFGGNSDFCGSSCDRIEFAAFEALADTGTGGAGQGGIVDLRLASGSFDTFGLSIDVRGVGGDGGYGNGVPGEDGSPGTGGTATLTFAGGTHDIEELSIDAGGFGGSGGSSGNGESGGHAGGNGGDGQGGEISLIVQAGSRLHLGSASFLANAEGGEGGDGESGRTGGRGGDGGNGSGGSIGFIVEGGELTMFGGEGGFDFEAEGDGGHGGRGGDGSDVGDTGGAGGHGGIGTGGGGLTGRGVVIRAALGGSADLVDIDIDISIDGDGGDGGEGGIGAGSFNEETGELIPETYAPGGDGGNARGGAALIEADDAAISYSESGEGFFSRLQIDADAEGGSGALGGTANGGTIDIRARNGGELFLPQSEFDAGAFGGFGYDTGGNGTGGRITVLADGGSLEFTALFGGSDTGLRLLSQGLGGESEGFGGDGQGGVALVRAVGANSTLIVHGATHLAAIGGDEESFPSSSDGVGGKGTGGEAAVEATAGASIRFEDRVDLFAFGRGGVGDDAGDGFGGIASILSSAGDIQIDGDVYLSATSYGGVSFDSEGGYGNGAGGGMARIRVESPAGMLGQIRVSNEESSGFIQLDATGYGGSEFFGCSSCARTLAADATAGVGSGGVGQGGTAEALIDGKLEVGSLSLDVRGFGGRGESGDDLSPGSDGIGGTATVDFRGNSNSLGFLGIDASGFGGNGGDSRSESEAVDGAAGGHGRGGTANLLANGGSATIDGLSIDARGDGGLGGRGGSFLDADEQVTVGVGGAGGDGRGGTILVEAGAGGTLTLPAAQFNASGRGENGGRGGSDFDVVSGAGGAGGDGFGGSVVLRSSGGSLTVRTTEVSGDGDGTVFTSVFGPTLNAQGFGGEGGDGGGADGAAAVGGVGGLGGDGTGGIALADSASGTMVLGSTFLDAGGFGGEGGSGGSGNSDASGGAGAAGGNGRGGTAALRTRGGTLSVFGENTVTNSDGTFTTLIGVELDARGAGGEGGEGGHSFSETGTPAGPGGAGGDGAGGLALLDVAGGSFSTGPARFGSNGSGGRGGFGGFSQSEAAAADGAAGSGTGGVARIGVADGAGGAAGRAALGASEMYASGFTGFDGSPGLEVSGSIVIAASAAADGSLSIESLYAEAEGGDGAGPVGFSLTTSGGAIEVIGDASIFVDRDASFAGTGAGSLRVGGDLSVDAGGSILLAQQARPPGIHPLLHAGNISFNAGGAILGATALVQAITDVRLRAAGDIEIEYALAGDDFDALSSGGDVVAGLVGITGDGLDLPESGYGSGDGRNIVIDAAGNVRLDDGSAIDAIRLTARGGRIDSAGLLTAVQLDAAAATDIALTDVDVVNSLVLATPNGAVSGRDFRSDGDILVDARDGITLARADAAGFIDLASSEGDIAAGAAIAGVDIAVRSPGGTIALGSAAAGRDIRLDAGGAIRVAAATAGDDFIATSTGADVTAASLVTTGLGEDGYGETGGDGSNIVLDSAGAIRLDNGSAADRIDLTARGGRIDSAGLLTAIQLDASAATDIALTDVDVVNSLVLATPAGAISGRNFASDNAIALTARDGITLAGATAGGRLEADSAGTISIGASRAADDIAIAAGGSVALGSASAGDQLSIQAGSGVAATALAAGGAVRVEAGGGIDVGSATAGAGAQLLAGGDIRLDFARVVGDIFARGAAVSLGDVTAVRTAFGGEGNISVFAADEAAIEDGDAAGFINVSSASFDGGTLSAGEFARVRTSSESGGTGAIAVASAAAGTFIDLAAESTIAAGSLTAGTDVLLRAGADIGVTTARAGDDFIATSTGGAVIARTVVTTGLGEDGYGETGFGDGSNIVIDAAGGVTLDNGDADNAIRLTSRGASVGSAGLLRAVDLGVDAARNIALTDLEIVNDIALRADDGFITGRDFRSQGSIDLDSAGNVEVAALGAGGVIRVRTDSDAALGSAEAIGDILVEARAIALAAAEAGRDILLGASGAVTVGAATAGDDFAVTSSGGTVAAANVVTTGLGEDVTEGGEGGTGPGDGSNIVIRSAGDARLDNGAAKDAIRLTSEAGSVRSAGLLKAVDLAAGSAADIALTDVDVVNDLNLATSGGSVTARNLASGGAVTLSASDRIELGGARAGGAFEAAAGTTFAAGTVTAAEISATANGDLALANGEAAQAIRLNSTAGTVSSSGLLKAVDLFIAAGEDIALNDIAIVNDISLRADNGAISGGDMFRSGGSITLSAAEAIDVDALEAGTFIRIDSDAEAVIGSARAGSDIAVAARTISLADAEAGRDIQLDSPGAIFVGTAKAGDDFVANAGAEFSGTLVITTGLGADSEGAANSAAITGQAAGAIGSNIAVDSVGALALRDGNAHGAMRLASTAGAIASAGTLNAGTTLTTQSATTTALSAARAGSGIAITAGGAVTGAALAAGTDVRIGSGGDVTLVSATAGDDVDIAATGTTRLDRAIATGTGTDDGGNGASVFVRSDSGVAIDRIDAAGGASLRADNGTVIVSTDLKAGRAVDASGRAVTLNAVGPLSVRSASASAGNVGLSSGGNLSIDSAQASAAVTAAAGGSIALNGDVNGTQLGFSSLDIAVGQNARVGTAARTTGIRLTANGGSVVIGGSGSGSGYRLDNAEFGRLTSRDVVIEGLASNAAVQIEGLTVRGSAASSPGVTGRLSIASGGTIDVVGKLNVENAGDNNAVAISAGNAFYADTATAGIAVTNGSALAGSVSINAPSITIASRAAAGALGGTIRERSDRLGQNDGPDDRGGYVQARGIALTASQRIHVQNSGLNGRSPDNRAGLTAGTQGITIITTGTAPVEIILNGRQDNGAGGFFTGRALVDRLMPQQSGRPSFNFAPGSTVNGCLIGAGACGVVVGPPVQPIIGHLSDEDEDSLTRPPLFAFGQLISVEGSPLLPVIDDPVTGTGNDDVWSPANAPGLLCDEDREDCTIDQPVTGSGNEELQRGESEGAPVTTLERPPASATVDAPVTGTGNEDLQDDGEDE